MEIKKLIVPSGIRYISDWVEYTLKDYNFPHILNKSITGCGYTEYCIRNDMNIILCSPRKILLENKEDQHQGNVYYVRNDIEKSVYFEKDLTDKPKGVASVMEKLGFTDEEKSAKVIQLKNEIKAYWKSCQENPFKNSKPCKILVTYDSFRHVKEALGEDIEKFYVVIDEFQSIFTDAKFKSDTELEFMEQIKKLQKVCYVSATPMLKEYLDMLEDFKDLPYYEMDWTSSDPGRVIKPQLDVKYCGKKNTIQMNIKKIIQKYLEGIFDVYRYRDNQGNLKEIQSKEAVIYVNSVKDIAKAVKASNLTIDQCNILVSRTKENETAIRKAFGGKVKDGITYIGKVPKQGEQHKMFTFCTRTVYLGADFYSTCAKSYIFSNANVDCLSVDISMDLPQILGRQRLEENPWKNSAELYITLKYNENSKEDFKAYMNKKMKRTNDLLLAYNSVADDSKDSIAEEYENLAKAYNYSSNYVAVNRHAGSNKVPVLNNLMMVAELRTFEIQKYDYRDRFTVFNALDQYNCSANKDRLERAVSEFENKYTTFVDKMKYICEQEAIFNSAEFHVLINLIPMEYRNYIVVLGPERIKANSYAKSRLEEEYRSIVNQQENYSDLEREIFCQFKPGDKDTKVNIKNKIGQIYQKVGYTKTPKATDLEQYFKIRTCRISNKLTGKKDAGFEIIKKKGD